MTAKIPRRMLGPISREMGGSQTPYSGSGDPASGITIDNNVDGYILKATGVANTIEGIPQLKWDSSHGILSASTDVYITGSSNYLYLHGVNASGATVRFKVQIDGSVLVLAEE